MRQRQKTDGAETTVDTTSAVATGQAQQSQQGNQSMVDRLSGGDVTVGEGAVGEKCRCGGITTGETTTMAAEAQDTEERYGPDIEMEAEYAHWIHYPQELLDAEMVRVEEYNHAFDGINDAERDSIDNRWARREGHLDDIADGWLSRGETADRSTPEWGASRGKAASEAADMFGPMATGEWSGFEGDLSHEGFSAGPVGAAWRSPSYSIADAFGDAYAGDGTAQSDADYQVPIKGYSKYSDTKGKVTSTAMYGYALGPEPRTHTLRWQLYKQLNWCPDYKQRRGLQFKSGSDGEAVGSSNGRAKDLRGGGSKEPKIEGYHQCEQWVRKDSKGKSDDRPMVHGQRQADTLLSTKKSEAELYKAYHQERLDYLAAMESGPGGQTTGE